MCPLMKQHNTTSSYAKGPSLCLIKSPIPAANFQEIPRTEEHADLHPECEGLCRSNGWDSSADTL